MTVATDIAALKARCTALEKRITTLEARCTTLEKTVTDHETRLKRLEARVLVIAVKSPQEIV